MNCELIDLGLTEYGATDKKQREILEGVKARLVENALILAEFFPVYTIGRSGSMDNLLVSRDFLKKEGIGLFRTNRGGDVTAHNPGQLVAYPVFNLAPAQKDLNWYLRSLEGAVIGLLRDYGVAARRRSGLTGVWVGDEKIASIGIAVSRWVAYHGLAVNINNDLSIFDFINPCGLKGIKVTSLAKAAGRAPDMAEVKYKLIKRLETIFGININAGAETAPVA